MKDHMMGQQKEARAWPNEEGQSIVLIALMIVGLLAMVGLAVDTGFLFARSSQFSSAVDAAALAGVIEMDPTAGNLDAPDSRALEFLAANGWPTSTLRTFVSTSTLTVGGIPQYTLTITWPVETFFLGLIGFDDVPITRASTAVYSAQAEIYTPSSYERSQVRKGSQFVLGSGSCSLYGEPVLPERASPPDTPNADPAHLEGVFRYRIRVPDTYTRTNTVRVELFDADSFNANPNNGAVIEHTDSYNGGVPDAGFTTCPGDMGSICALETGESLTAVNQNPYWFVRVDENINSDCQHNPSPNGNTVTVYELYYLDDDGARQSLATYTADNSTPATDLNWVTPGVTPGIPVDSGSAGTFDVDVSPIPEIDDNQHIYMDVTTSGGTARNVFDVHARLPDAFYPSALEPNVNDRNLQLADNPTRFRTDGLAVFAIGRMPLQNYVGDRRVTMPLAPIDSAQGGGTVYSTIFDYDVTAPRGITFTIDSVSANDFRIPAQIVADPNPDPLLYQTTCDDGSGDCNNTWLQPQLRMGIPDTFFFGGNLEATYVPRENAHTWAVSITSGRPFLSR
jgi:hypothetical protein